MNTAMKQPEHPSESTGYKTALPDKELIIKIEEDETGIAVLEEGQLVEIYLDRLTRRTLIGNIYKGYVENVLPGMQAAFVNIGLEKNSFLYVDDAMPKRCANEQNIPHEKKSISDVLKRGQEIMVQVFKDPVGSKGARVTTHPTLPGRYLVLMPTGNYIAISRRIEDPAECQRLKDLVAEILPPEMGIIIRTVAKGVGHEELANDLKMLLKQWRRIQGQFVQKSAPALIHRDLDLLQRIIRDANPEQVKRVVVNSPETREKVLEVIGDHIPEFKNKILLCQSDLFDDLQIRAQIEEGLRRKVWLKSGGYIVFDQVEALTIVDVNTGKYVGETSLSDTVVKTNMEAATEIARQLRLRNLGGIIIVDFIDMDCAEARINLLAYLDEQLKRDRTRVTVLGMTQLGLVEMTRKKIGHELGYALEKECPHCHGKGKILSEETVAVRVKVEINKVAPETEAPALVVRVSYPVYSYLNGPFHKKMQALEAKWNKKIRIQAVDGAEIDEFTVRGDYQ